MLKTYESYGELLHSYLFSFLNYHINIYHDFRVRKFLWTTYRNADTIVESPLSRSESIHPKGLIEEYVKIFRIDFL